MEHCVITNYGHDIKQEQFFAENQVVRIHTKEDLLVNFCMDCKGENSCIRKSIISGLLDDNLDQW